MRASELQDKPVISIADGAKIGRISDVLFDTANLQLAGLLLKTDGGQSVLPFGSIRSIGSDAVTVESGAATNAAAGPSGMGSLRGFNELKGLPVASVDGSHLGDVREIKVDRETGALVDVTAHRGGVLGLGGESVTIDKAAIRRIGEKLITVELPAQDRQETTSA